MKYVITFHFFQKTSYIKKHIPIEKSQSRIAEQINDYFHNILTWELFSSLISLTWWCMRRAGQSVEPWANQSQSNRASSSQCWTAAGASRCLKQTLTYRVWFEFYLLSTWFILSLESEGVSHRGWTSGIQSSRGSRAETCGGGWPSVQWHQWGIG